MCLSFTFLRQSLHSKASFIMCSSPEKELKVKTIKDQFQIGECNKRSSDLLKSVTMIVIKI